MLELKITCLKINSLSNVALSIHNLNRSPSIFKNTFSLYIVHIYADLKSKLYSWVKLGETMSSKFGELILSNTQINGGLRYV